ncbi:hypothetical protein [Amycolatopsis nalaikhensis]|uniref:Secreted protein n=1 Tax=Amycolatopsis nalaikhensis TaxID=715472 RepID=A0ABY8XSU3_9PSEU|nr:hypothetical protein [Amycolatopsis sp. 2-2]WIV58731.1 hypothetical protein QP939_08930 [Amycolatopsis sp. 2-2]
MRNFWNWIPRFSWNLSRRSFCESMWPDPPLILFQISSVHCTRKSTATLPWSSISSDDFAPAPSVGAAIPSRFFFAWFLRSVWACCSLPLAADSSFARATISSVSSFSKTRYPSLPPSE